MKKILSLLIVTTLGLCFCSCTVVKTARQSTVQNFRIDHETYISVQNLPELEGELFAMGLKVVPYELASNYAVRDMRQTTGNVDVNRSIYDNVTYNPSAILINVPTGGSERSYGNPCYWEIRIIDLVDGKLLASFRYERDIMWSWGCPSSNKVMKQFCKDLRKKYMR